MKVIKAKCPYCKTEHIREEVETELNMTRYRAEVNCDHVVKDFLWIIIENL